VVKEFTSVALKKFSTTFNDEQIKEYLSSVLYPLWHVSTTQDLIMNAITINTRYKYTFYDSLLIAAAIKENCTHLLTEDMQHHQKIDSI
jgi:predicted nucleic acid-binding protein